MKASQLEPIVSIVIPTYNQAHFLEKALESVFAQSFILWEAIIVNNYSSDSTVEIVKKFTDPRVHLINFRNNGIIAASRNIGISNAKGEWIAFLDSDDTWHPEKLERCLCEVAKNNADAICHGECWTRSDGYSRNVEYGPEFRATYKSLLFDGNCISTSAVVVRRNLLEKVGLFSRDLGFVTAEDYDLWLRLAKYKLNITFIPEVLGKFRIHPAGNSQSVMRNTTAIMNVIEQHYSELEPRRILDIIRFRRAKSLVLYGGGRGLQKQNYRINAFKLFLKSMFIYPFVLRTYIAIFINCLPNSLKAKVQR